ncbi:MAG: hypothetical protein NkDv07_0120 [Candidatus Improbicoccus devescovinae]|nr:MAG: hypothetical protein NkDv07_0120 [Candidatus Improbicoccus devescovinae]
MLYQMKKSEFKVAKLNRPTTAANRRLINSVLKLHSNFKENMKEWTYLKKDSTEKVLKNPDTPRASKCCLIYIPRNKEGTQVSYVWDNSIAANAGDNAYLYQYISETIDKSKKKRKKLTMITQKCTLINTPKVKTPKVKFEGKGTKYIINDIFDAVDILNDSTTFKKYLGLTFREVSGKKRASSIPMNVTLMINRPKLTPLKKIWYYGPGETQDELRGNDEITNTIKTLLSEGDGNKYEISIGEEEHGVTDWTDIEERLNRIAKRCPDKEYILTVNPVCNLTIKLPDGKQKELHTIWKKDVNDNFTFLNDIVEKVISKYISTRRDHYTYAFHGVYHNLDKDFNDLNSPLRTSDFTTQETITIQKGKIIRVELEIEGPPEQKQTLLMFYNTGLETQYPEYRFYGRGFDKLKKLIEKYKEIPEAAFRRKDNTKISLCSGVKRINVILDKANLIPKDNNDVKRKVTLEKGEIDEKIVTIWIIQKGVEISKAQIKIDTIDTTKDVIARAEKAIKRNLQPDSVIVVGHVNMMTATPLPPDEKPYDHLHEPNCNPDTFFIMDKYTLDNLPIKTRKLYS